MLHIFIISYQRTQNTKIYTSNSLYRGKEWIYGDGKHIFQDQNNDLHIWYQG